MENQLRYTIALMGIKGVGSILARHLIEAFGSAQAVLEADETALRQIPRIGQAIIEQRRDPRLLQRADAEMQFMHAHHIQPLFYGQSLQQDTLPYPHRLSECQDAPTLLFKLGSANLESKHIVSIVGTRSCSQYGRDMVNRLVGELKEALPDLVIVSGLALGIDVSAHKAALEHGVPTVGVVAHGLDRIYPYIHKGIAREMVQQGGAIVTEYTTGTEPERCNCLIFNNFSFLSTSFFCKIPSLFIIKIIGQFGHIKKLIVNFCKNFQFFSLFSKNVPIWCPFTLPISL